MKKIILILVLVLPVVVTVLIYMVAGFIIREMNVPFLTEIRRNYDNLRQQDVLVASAHGRDFFINRMTVGQRVRLNDYIIPQPNRVPFTMITFVAVTGGGSLDNLNDSLKIVWSGNTAYLEAYREFTANDFQGRAVEVWIMGTDGRILGTIFVENVV